MDKLHFRVTLVLAFLVGFTSLIYEVVATKTLFFFFVENTHSVGIVLATFLLGLAGGALLFRVLSERMNPWTMVFLSQILAGGYAMLEFANFGYLPLVLDWLEKAIPNTWTFVVLKMVICGIHVGVPALLMGVVLPLVLARAADKGSKAAAGISWIYALDLVGSALGALVAGLWLLPIIGVHSTVYLTAILNFVIAGWAAVARRFWAGIGIAAAVSAASAYLLVLTWGGLEAPSSEGDDPSWFDADSWVFFDVLDRQHSPYGVITVGQHPELGKIMYANYRVLCVEHKNDSEYEMGALVGLFFEERDREKKNRVLSVGLGCGYTLLALDGSPVLDPIDVVEINPAIIDLAPKHFAESTENVFASEKVTIHEDEGYHFVRTTGNVYDTIVVDIENPSVIHSSPLYTDEFFAAAKKKMAPDGLIAVWAYAGGAEYCKVLYNTMRRHFAHVLIRSNIDGNYVYFASSRPMDALMQTPREMAFQRHVLAHPTDAINTLGNQVLQRLFKPREYFFLPDWYEDPYIPRLSK
jgi:predicted membrane-bound spermidine synthase